MTVNEDYYLPGIDAVKSERSSTFLKNALPPFSGSKNKPSK
jgi:hypothetical protein